nr:replicative DNA helicase [Actinomycetota bacterium]
MTIQELFPGAASSGPADDRLPPQDLHAEQSVLGGMLLSKDAIADCVEVLRSVDFYRPAHEGIYEAVLNLYGRGEPADAITVSDELSKRGDLTRVGGQAYLHQLVSLVPTAANAGYYAQIVVERAVLRRLVEAGTKIVQLGYAQGGGDVEDIVNAAQAEVYAVADKRGGEDYHRLGDVLEMTVDEIEVASGKSGEMTGVPTGFTDLDSLTNGFHAGQMIVVAARPAIGKALALDTPLPTPTGWTTMGQVAVGDEVMGADGLPTRVVAATEVMLGRPCYEVEFSDGSVIVADEQHQWLTETRASRRSFQSARDRRNRYRNQRTFAAVRTTAVIASTLRTQAAEARLNHSVVLASPLALPDRVLPLSPYVLGAWLGDGTSASAAITTADDEMVMHLEAEGMRVTKTSAVMRYSLRWPEPEVAERQCLVCGMTFVPATSQVRTCERSCGGRSKGLDEPRRIPVCPDCGRPSSGMFRCQACHGDHETVQGSLRSMGVLHNKHIPDGYLRSSERQR